MRGCLLALAILLVTVCGERVMLDALGFEGHSLSIFGGIVLFGEKYSVNTVAGAVLLPSLASILLLTASPRIFDFLGYHGARVLERLIGMAPPHDFGAETLDGVKVSVGS